MENRELIIDELKILKSKFPKLHVQKRIINQPFPVEFVIRFCDDSFRFEFSLSEKYPDDPCSVVYFGKSFPHQLRSKSNASIIPLFLRSSEVDIVQFLRNRNNLFSLFTPSVDSSFEVQNGMTGMMRDIVLRLLDLLSRYGENIHHIIGMCQEHFMWRRHSYFIESRKKFSGCLMLPMDFLRDYEKLEMVEKIFYGSLRILKNDNVPILLKDLKLRLGIIRWTVEVYPLLRCKNALEVGIIPFFPADAPFDPDLYDTFDSACGVGVRKKEKPYLFSPASFVDNICRRKKENSDVTLEVDFDAGTLAVNLDGIYSLHAILNIPRHFYFGVRVKGFGWEFCLKSLVRVQRATVPVRAFSYYPYSCERDDYNFIL